MPVNCDPLPRMYPPVMLPVVDIVLLPNPDNSVLTFELPYPAEIPVKNAPLPIK